MHSAGSWPNSRTCMTEQEKRSEQDSRMRTRRRRHQDVRIRDSMIAGQPLGTVHANAPVELVDVLNYAATNGDFMAIHRK
jgi:hypothetical protein